MKNTRSTSKSASDKRARIERAAASSDPRSLIKLAAGAAEADQRAEQAERVAERERAWRHLRQVDMPLSEEEMALIGELGAVHDEVDEAWADDFHDLSRALAVVSAARAERLSRSLGDAEPRPETPREVAKLDGMPLARAAKRRAVQRRIGALAIDARSSGRSLRMERRDMEDDAWRRLADEVLFPPIPARESDAGAALAPTASIEPVGAICCACGEPCLDPEPCSSGGGRCSACVSGGARCMGCAGACGAVDETEPSGPSNGCGAPGGLGMGVGGVGRDTGGRKSWCRCGRAGCCGCPDCAAAAGVGDADAKAPESSADVADASLGSSSRLRSLLILALGLLLMALALSLA